MCAGCGEHLMGGRVEGLEDKANYLFCEHSGQLYCKRWCHFGSHVPIPERVMKDFDFMPCSVSILFHQYFLEVSNKPIIRMDSFVHSLCSTVPNLGEMYDARREATACLRQLHLSDARKYRLSDIISSTVGFRRSHLILNDFMCSLEDLVSISQGHDLILQLRDFVTILKNCINI